MAADDPTPTASTQPQPDAVIGPTQPQSDVVIGPTQLQPDVVIGPTDCRGDSRAMASAEPADWSVSAAGLERDWLSDPGHGSRENRWRRMSYGPVWPELL